MCAEKLHEKYAGVDYFPSFEIVTSGGLNSFNPDNVHARLPIVRRVMAHMLESYFPDLIAESKVEEKAARADARI